MPTLWVGCQRLPDMAASFMRRLREPLIFNAAANLSGWDVLPQRLRAL